MPTALRYQCPLRFEEHFTRQNNRPGIPCVARVAELPKQDQADRRSRGLADLA